MGKDRVGLEVELLRKLDSLSEVFTKGLPKNFAADFALAALHEYGHQNLKTYQNFSEKLVSSTTFDAGSEQENGMNSPGILWDRLTILICKRLFTAPSSPHFNVQFHKKNVNIDSELKSVLTALHQAKPAKYILLAKEATERQTHSTNIGISLWDLQISNLAMWINQDLLYTANLDQVDTFRLRSYIKFFSEANKIRNISIERIELFYLQKLLKRHL